MVRITKEAFSTRSHFCEEDELDRWPYENNAYNQCYREDLEERMRRKVDNRPAPSLISEPVLIRSCFASFEKRVGDPESLVRLTH